MIVDAVIWVLRGFLRTIAFLLPEGSLSAWIPDTSGWGSFIGTKVGPLNSFAPVAELFVFLDVFLNIWLPAVLAYQLVFWIYAHMPVIGKG